MYSISIELINTFPKMHFSLRFISKIPLLFSYRLLCAQNLTFPKGLVNTGCSLFQEKSDQYVTLPTKG